MTALKAEYVNQHLHQAARESLGYNADKAKIKKLTATYIAAPDMLTALEELAILGEQGMKPNYAEWLTFHDKVAQMARAAIRKVRGEQHKPRPGET